MVIGRSTECATLDTALRTARDGQGSGVFLCGEPGIGKTRLAAEATGRALDAGMVVLRGRCSTTGPPVPFRPLTEALFSLVRTADPSLPRRLGPYRPVLGRLVLDWSDGNTPTHDGALIVLAEAVLRLTSILGEDRGCVLAIDDLHDGDVETLAVLEYLLGNIADQPVMVLAGLRSVPSPAMDVAAAATRRDEAVRLDLRRLDEREVSELVAECLGSASGSRTPVPEEVNRQIFVSSAGNPLMVVELLNSVLASGDLVSDAAGWRLVNSIRPRVSLALAETVAQRAERLGADGVRLLSVAAVVGQSFPVSTVQRVVGLSDRELIGHLRAAVTEQLLLPDDRGPDWYAFAHPLTAEAMLAQLTPADRAEVARQAADAVIAEHPDLPGEWCHLAASMRLGAGQLWEAAELHVLLSRRALAEGALGTAVATMGDTVRLLGKERDDPRHQQEYSEILEVLLVALAESGQFDRAVQVADELSSIGADRDVTHRIERHVRLAWAAQVAGRWSEGAEQVQAARALLPVDAKEQSTATVDAVDAYLTMFGPVPDRVRRSEELARRAVAGAERIPLPDTVCQALYAVGFAVRDRDIAESDRCFHQMLAVAAENHLTNWRNYALVGLGGNAWLAEADPTGLQRAHRQSLRTGSISLALNSAGVLCLDAALRGDFQRAEATVAECLAETRRIKLVAVVRYALMVRAVLAGQRADRRAMRAAITEFEDSGGDQSSEVRLVKGLAQVFCALLEEDRAGAVVLLDEIAADQARQQSIFYLSGQFGLKLLLDVLAGRAGRAEHAEIERGAPGRMRWNRQFVALAEAVLLGREGRPAEAEAAVKLAQEAAAPFATAGPLGLRLVAEAAIEDNWGRPGEWLQAAEEHFHRAEITPVAGACRTLLRRSGATVRQRRAGTERVPDVLRQLGVTSREYEVFELLPARLGNKALGARLHISVRTAEKHVASLLAKIAVPDRAALIEYAARLLSD